MTDLTKITTPFGLLDPETQAALMAHGGPYELYEGPDWVDWTPVWSTAATYRVKSQPLTKPSIDWDHVAPKWKWLARDANGSAWIYDEKPVLRGECGASWSSQSDYLRACVFASYAPGTCDWKDSLVERPE